MERRRKRELRDLNLRAWEGEKDIFPVQGSLDSSMKKNTAFIKRLRTAINSTGQSLFIQEVRTLSLHKYLSEVIQACYEGLCKLKTPAEIAAGVEVVSALHQRFGPDEFTAYIGWLIGRGLSTPDKGQLKVLAQDVREREERERLARQRPLLRVVTELWLVGCLKSLDDIARPEEAGKIKDTKSADITGKGRSTSNGVRSDTGDPEPFPLEVLKDMLGHDREHVNLPLVVLFVKSFSWDILGVKTKGEGRRSDAEDSNAPTASDGREDSTGTEDEGAPTEDPPIASEPLRQRFRNVLLRYFDDVKAHIVKDHRLLVSQGRRNEDAYVKSGEVFEDRQASYDRQLRSQEKLVANAQTVAGILGIEMPDLKEKDTAIAGTDGGIGLVKTGEYLRGQGDGPGIWEDMDERRFYEIVVDLKERFPKMFEEQKKRKEDEDQVVKKFENRDDALEKGVKDSNDGDPAAADAKRGDGEDQSTVITNKTVGAQVDDLLARLPELTTKEKVDELAIDFCLLNSKASRNRMIKALQEVPKGRTDLLPLYARLVATLGKYMLDISQALVGYLDDEFRSLQRRKTKDFLGQVRMMNVRYLAELTKFGVVPDHVIFHCLKVSLDDFSRMNIEIIANLLENCGRYLLRNPETSPRMSSFMETLSRKKGAQHLGQQERMLIENAMYYVNPPDRAAIQQKERDPVDLFLRKLIYLDLTKRDLVKITHQIRKLHWEEKEVVDVLRKIFSKPGKMKYNNIFYLAEILDHLKRYHLDFIISVVDDLLESITLGLEIPDFKFNQRRIAEVKYLGELYLYKCVDSQVVFDTLYKIVAFGHEGGTPKPDAYNMLDPPDEFFRIRLVCSLIETCGEFFNKGAAQKRFDFFLTFFQYYIYTKDALPMDIEFAVQDAFAHVRPQWKLAPNLEEAGKTFAEAVKRNYQSQNAEKVAEMEEAAEDSLSEDGADDERLPEHELEEGSSEEEVEDGEDVNTPEQQSGSEEEQFVVKNMGNQRDPEAEAEFDREFTKMMAESVESRKFERKPMFDVPLPMRRAPARETATTADDSEGDTPAPPAVNPGTMKFSLLSKRGNRQQASITSDLSLHIILIRRTKTRPIDLPSDSNFAIAMRNQQQAERAEQQRIKSLVLNYDLREETEPDGDSPLSSVNNYNKTLKSNPNRKSPSIPAATQIRRIEQHTYDSEGTIDKHAAQPRFDKAGNNRSTQRARKLQLSDVDWC
ncbi:ARM repeat-containing protein [Viridothelium virens]|uniref:ARM repeat-containing protein n=1 Tax=Viridothelium virens TaxID=1048519 RepID=A0A6A6GZA2_VIRVR|nr:ARM repeat-containing protein [Viridothelium virens]